VRLFFEFSTDIIPADLKSVRQMLQIFSPLRYGDGNTDFRLSWWFAVDVTSFATSPGFNPRSKYVRFDVLFLLHVIGILLIL
jgi:hypothetical protein